MAREFARIKISIWADEDFRSLPADAKYLYTVLLSHPSMSYAGIVDWRPSRIGTLCGYTEDQVRQAAEHLGSAGYVVIDDRSEELLVRSYIRNEELMKKPRLPVSVMKAFALIASTDLRQVVVHELNRLHSEAPEMQCWTHSMVAPVLAQTAVNGASFRPSRGSVTALYGESYDKPYEEGYEESYDKGLGETVATATGIATGTRTTATATATKQPSTSGIEIPEEETPLRVDVEQVCKHLADRIEGNGSKRPTITKRWRDEARLMLDRDGRTLEQITKAIDWCQNDSFWKTNVMSMPKLREKFDQIRLKALDQQRAQRPGPVAPTVRRGRQPGQMAREA